MFRKLQTGQALVLGYDPKKPQPKEYLREVRGYLCAVIPARKKNEANRLQLQDEKTGEIFHVFSTRVLDNHLTVENPKTGELEVPENLRGRLIKIVFTGIGGHGQNRYKNFDIFVDTKKRLAKTKAVPF